MYFIEAERILFINLLAKYAKWIGFVAKIMSLMKSHQMILSPEVCSYDCWALTESAFIKLIFPTRIGQDFLEAKSMWPDVPFHCGAAVTNQNFCFHLQFSQSADIVIEIPGNLGQEDSSYLLDYYPPYGNPLPNTTIASKDVGDEIQFSNVLAGTKYNFWLYYTNASHHNLLAWTVSITTGEFPQTNFCIECGCFAAVAMTPTDRMGDLPTSTCFALNSPRARCSLIDWYNIFNCKISRSVSLQ